MEITLKDKVALITGGGAGIGRGTTMLVDGGGLAAGGFQRMPNGEWTIRPLVTGNVFASL